MTSFLVCDDHGLMRDALAQMLSGLFPDARIMTARDFPDAFALLSEPFDLCITDFVMPGSEPLAGIRQITVLQPQMPVIVISGQSDHVTISGLLALGIAGIIPKTLDAKIVEATINLVLAGGRYMPPEVINVSASAKAGISSEGLTAQQVKVLELLVHGKTNKEIAKELGVAPSTMNFHVDSILVRLSARSRSEACAKYIAMRAQRPT
jgi:DNA-binding NarL/FixJ family response regulator